MYASDPTAVSTAVGSVRNNPPGRTDTETASDGEGTRETPLRDLCRIADEFGGGFRLSVKLESFQPSGSVKDRAANHIVGQAIAEGKLGPGRTLIDASSGNTGVAYALLGERLGFAVELCLPRNVHPQRLARILGSGATVALTDPLEGTDGAQREARRRAESDPARYFYPDQYNHPGNPEAHYRSTGPEIWRQTAGGLTHFVAGVGTGGTISGAGRYLKERRPTLSVIAVEPAGPMHGLEGLKHLPTALRPGTYDPRVIDRTLRVETEDALAMRRHILEVEDLTVGVSAAAAVVASIEVGRSSADAWVVTIAPDAGHPSSSEDP